VKRSLVLAFAVLAIPRAAFGDSFGGFGGREDVYLVGSDRICAPLTVSGGAATGAPSCQKGSDADVAQLDVKKVKAVSGKDAAFTAAAKGRTLTITSSDQAATVVTWDAPDPIGKVTAVYASQYGNLVAVEYTVRRGGHDATDVVGFDLRGHGGTTTTQPDTTTTTQPTAGVEPPPVTPPMKKALKAARSAAKGSAKKAIKAWNKVLALDPDSSEGRFGLAAAQAKAKKKDDAIATLEALAQSQRTDAIEFLIQARFDKAFASVRADARYRAATGLDKPYGTFYERLMGAGGTWEQAGTACDTPTVDLIFNRDRTFKLKVQSKCEGERYEDTFKGDWQPAEPVVTMVLHNRGKPDENFECSVEREGDEDAIHCNVDEDLAFVVRPVRR
jgi:hypothetical protein